MLLLSGADKLQRGDDVGRAAEEAERVVIAEHRYVVDSRAANGEAVEVNTAVVKAPSQRDSIGMERSNEIGPRSEVLCPAGIYGHSSKKRQNQQSHSGRLPLFATFDCHNRRAVHERMRW